MSDTTPCPHPPTRHFAWFAHDGTLCVACCDCGAVLAGAEPATLDQACALTRAREAVRALGAEVVDAV